MNGFLSKISRFIIPCFVVCFLLISCLPLASASDLTEPTEYIENTEAVEPSQPALEPYNGDLVLTSVDTHIMTVTPNDANGFKKILLQLFGNYEMVTKEYTYTGTNGYTTKQVTTESDYPWMISAGLFTVVLYCLFRLLGGVLCGGK